MSILDTKSPVAGPLHHAERLSRDELLALAQDRISEPLADFGSPHTECKINMDQLCRWRLERVQQEMRKRDISAVVCTNPVNIRYATGLAVMTAWTSVNLARYALIPAAGDPVMFEYGKALFRA